MSTQNFSLERALLIGITTVILAACSSPPVKFYTLSPMPVESVSGADGLALAVGPAEFPRALDRNQIVTRDGPNQFTVDEYHVWSALLHFDFLRVLGENLASELKTDRMAVYPATPAFVPDYRVLTDVLQFDGSLGENVILRTRWTIVEPGSGNAIAIGTFENTQPLADKSYDALAAGHSHAIAALSRAIAAKLTELGKPSAVPANNGSR